MANYKRGGWTIGIDTSKCKAVSYEKQLRLTPEEIHYHTSILMDKYDKAVLDFEQKTQLTNCRNTAEIAASIGSLVDMRQEPYVNDVHGEKPKAVFYNDKAAVRGIAERFVKNMLDNRIALDEMVILSVHSLEHSALHGVTELAGIPVSNTMEEGKVWVTTTRKYKGLEAKAVLLTDVEVSKLTDAVMQRMIYIGGSRANTYLKVAFYEDVEKGDYRGIVDALQEKVKVNYKDIPADEADADVRLPCDIEIKLPGTRKSVLKLLQMEAEAQ